MTVQGSEADMKIKYEILDSFISKFKDDRIILIRDMNPHTGILGENTNPNGLGLLNFAEKHNFELDNREREGHLVF